MYRIESSGALLRAHRALASRRIRPRVSRTVVLLGICSLLTDISSEMVAAVLPLYLVTQLGFTPLQFGIVDGLYQGAAAFVRLAGGYIGDRRRRHKGVAAIGYGLSAVCKLALAAVGSAFGAIAAIVLVDRAGKGLRTAPRDAMISLSSRREDLGTAFGVHRALDTTGALLGPLVAFGLLALAPLAFDSCSSSRSASRSPASACSCCSCASRSAGASRRRARRAGPPARRVGAAARRALPRRCSWPPPCSAWRRPATASSTSPSTARSTSTPRCSRCCSPAPRSTFMLLAAPVGRLADRIGRGRVMLGGYVLLLGVYATLLGAVGGRARDGRRRCSCSARTTPRPTAC